MNIKDLNNLELIENITQGGTIYIKDNLLYKILNDPYFFPDEILKALISSISLLLNIDLERYIDNTSKDINIEYIYNTIVKKYNNSILNKYLEEIILGNTIPYFDDYLLSKNNKIKKLSLK